MRGGGLPRNASRARREGDPSASRWEIGCERAFDALLALLICVAPLFMGGRGPVGKLVAAALILGMGLSWQLRLLASASPRWKRTGVELLLLAAMAIPLLQLAPFSASGLATVSPWAAERLVLWRPGATPFLGAWSQISLHPDATRRALAMIVCYSMLFVLLVQRLRSHQDMARLIRLIAAAAVGLAALALLQRFTSDGRFLWIYEHPFRSARDAVKGPFSNQNHFAHLLALSVAPLVLGQLDESTRGARWRWFCRVGLAVVLVAALLTVSRGGIAAVALSLTVTTVACWRKGWLRPRSVAWVAAVGFAVTLLIAMHGFERIAERAGAVVNSRSLEDVDTARWRLWTALVHAAPQFPLGAGAGAHRVVYPSFLPHNFDVEFSHGECGPLQVALETGIPGVAVMLLAIGVALRWCGTLLRSEDSSASRLGVVCSAAVIASVAHSLVDFVWYLSACMVVTLAMLAIACRARQLLKKEVDGVSSSHRVTRPFCMAGLAACGAGALGVLALLLPAARAAPHWDACLRIANQHETNPTDAALQQMLDHLQAGLRRNPGDLRMNVKAALYALRLFDQRQAASANPMPLAHVRDAALNAGFASAAEMRAWIGRSVGANAGNLATAFASAQRAITASPVEGNAYLVMAETVFLQTNRAAEERELVRQAALVRPYSPPVQFAVGRQLAMAGKEEQAIARWRWAMRQDSLVRRQIIEALAPQTPGDEFLKTFQPDWQGMMELYQHYRHIGRDDEAIKVGPVLAGTLERRSNPLTGASGQLLQAAEIWRFLQRPTDALRCLDGAIGRRGGNYSAHLARAQVLLELRRPEEAREEYRHCQLVAPHDPQTQALGEALARYSGAATAEASRRR